MRSGDRQPDGDQREHGAAASTIDRRARPRCRPRARRHREVGRRPAISANETPTQRGSSRRENSPRRATASGTNASEHRPPRGQRRRPATARSSARGTPRVNPADAEPDRRRDRPRQPGRHAAAVPARRPARSVDMSTTPTIEQPMPIIASSAGALAEHDDREHDADQRVGGADRRDHGHRPQLERVVVQSRRPSPRTTALSATQPPTSAVERREPVPDEQEDGGRSRRRRTPGAISTARGCRAACPPTAPKKSARPQPSAANSP